MSREEFEQLRDAGGFLEWFEVYGQLKGTPREQVEARLRAGEDVLMEVDVQGRWRSGSRSPTRCWSSSGRRPGRYSGSGLVARGGDDDEQLARRSPRPRPRRRWPTDSTPSS